MGEALERWRAAGTDADSLLARGARVAESIANRTGRWEEQVVLALHRLARATGRVQEQPSSRDSEWENVHRAFHSALISGCGSHWLISFCEHVATQMHRYRMLATAAEGEQRDCTAEHRLIAEAAIDGDADRAVAALVEPYRKSAALVCFAQWAAQSAIVE
ncbi:FCD domain-containing protein [Mesorhizobium sp. Root695]|uniref:FCD domain-containing protein n=1 Tax=Mesorhizobium sp. Root695 TaxID=1736589 RepID=UPI002378E779|nr:FCD domain-containing protein [Mesorhizobium sp. Root695]